MRKRKDKGLVKVAIIGSLHRKDAKESFKKHRAL
jgi:hypothetical protein